MSRMWMVAYDISNDRIRQEVREILYDYGTRVQYSMFECTLVDQEKTAVQEELAALIEKSDSIRWYPLCSWCKGKMVIQGKGSRTDDGDFYLV